MRALTLVAGLLLGAACSDQIVALADAATDAYTPDVAVDTSTAEALAELAALVEAHGVQLAALAAADEAAAADRQVIRADVFNLKTADIPIKKDIAELKSRAEALEAANQSLVQSIQAVQDVVDALKTDLEDDSCPEDMTAAADVCVETLARPAQSVFSAHDTCAAIDRRLCTMPEMIAGCEGGVDAAPEASWTATLVGDGVLITTIGDPFCNPSLSSVSPFGGVGRPFRCCLGR